MKSLKTGDGFILILQKDERLVGTVQNFCKSQSIKGGFITGLGAVSGAELGFYDLESKEYRWRKFDQLLEITSLNGMITEDSLHIHTTLSDNGYSTHGGHLKEATVGGTCEIYLKVFDTSLRRKPDESTGLNLINLDES